MRHYDWTGFNEYEIARAILEIKLSLIEVKPLPTSSWQSQADSKHPEMQPQEFENVIIELDIPETKQDLANLIQPNLPWAEDHFQERIGGIPYNPPPSSSWWPYAQVDNAEHKHGQQFSHTYPERIWPRFANVPEVEKENRGIRYRLGDLDDLIRMLGMDLYTRQAYLPIWFPEDTGAASNQRVPCTLGYHFRVRPYGDYLALHVNYYMRSCDIMRHMVDDIYMAARLGQLVKSYLTLTGLPEIAMGTLTCHFASLHLFTGDVSIVKSQNKLWRQTNGRGFSHANK